jgi:DNA-binding TFAR19-related protein (PDSD5 family)
MAVVFTWPGRGRLEVRWVQAVSNPRRPRRDVEEALRQNLVELVAAGRIEPEEAESRFARFLERRGARA